MIVLRSASPWGEKKSPIIVNMEQIIADTRVRYLSFELPANQITEI